MLGSLSSGPAGPPPSGCLIFLPRNTPPAVRGFGLRAPPRNEHARERRIGEIGVVSFSTPRLRSCRSSDARDWPRCCEARPTSPKLARHPAQLSLGAPRHLLLVPDGVI